MTWLDRLGEEIEDLKKKIKALDRTLVSMEELPPTQQSLLRVQRSVMLAYLDIIVMREKDGRQEWRE